LQIKEFLDSVCEQIKYKPIREDIAEELKNHIEELKENYIQEGMKEDIAEQKAIEQMGDSKEIGKRLNKIHRPKLDWKLLLILTILLCFGFLVVLIRNGLDGNSHIGKYIIFLIIGIIFGTAIYFIDYKRLSKYSNILYLIATGLIIFTMFFGRMVNGIPHLYIGNIISCVPTVISMPLYILAFIGFIECSNKESKLQNIISKYVNIRININFIKIIILSIFSLILCIQIPSMASASVLGLTYMILGTAKILQTKENKIKNIIKLWGSITAIGVVLLLLVLGVSPYRWDRLQITINPESDPEGGGWIAINRKEIIESAKFFGESENMSNAIDLFDEGTDYAFIAILAHYRMGNKHYSYCIYYSIKHKTDFKCYENKR